MGAVKERRIWDSGVTRWSEFIDADEVCGISAAKKDSLDSCLKHAYELLDNGGCAELGRMLKGGEHWRLFGRFGDSAAYLDIETDGLERDSTVTVVTVHKRNETITLANGEGLCAESLADALDGVSMLVSFNGRSFDVPVLRCSFPGVDLDIPHFDLRFGCRRVGLTGGLKNIEREIGISRSDDIAEVDGLEAVRLWHRWNRYRDRDAFDTLVAYNRADTVNLERLASVVYGKLSEDCPFSLRE